MINERWSIHCHSIHPNSSLAGQPRAPETVQLAS